MADEEKEESTEEQAEERKHILQEAEKVIKTPNIIEATNTEESDAEKALKILLGEEK
ncbi:hypothetical protein [Coprococcus comes]|uniref:hypothetical protein n=1 Tax=Coprococcus comes TaxID=410072 RepID=UPI0015F33C3A